MKPLEPIHKGQIAVLMVEARAVAHRVIVSRPTVEARYDLVLDWNGRLYRAQVKYAAARSTSSANTVCVNLASSGKPYLSDEIDLLFVWLPALQQLCCFGPEVFHGKSALHIRLEPTKSGQVAGCLFAHDHFW